MRDVLAVEPKTFIAIERGIASINFFELEKFHHFFDVDLFAVVLRRPTEQAKIIAHRFRRISLLHVDGDASALIALAHLRSVVIKNERNVRKTWRRRAKRAVKLDMLGRVGKMIFTANNVRDFHLDVVDDVDEMKNP